MSERVTISDIAKELGVSTATVSNVIHGKTAKISGATVKRVQEHLESRQYIPSMAGILLAQNDSKIVGLIVRDHEKYEGHILEDGFVSASANALVKQLDLAGYFMMIKVTTDLKEIIKYACMWNMSGLVLIGFSEQEYQYLRDHMSIPFVVYDALLEGDNQITNLVIDNYDGGRQIGEHFQELGHPKALCISDNDLFLDHNRVEGLKSILPLSELLLIPVARQDREAFYLDHLEYIRGFSAVFAVSDYYAADFIYFLHAQGISVPEEISVAGFDDSILSRQIYPQITTIQQDYEMRAKMTVRLLEKQRMHTNTESQYTLPVTLIQRASTGLCRN